MLFSEKNAPHARKDSFRKRDGGSRNDWPNAPGPERPVPMMTATNIHYEQAARTKGLTAGGIGAIPLLAQRIEHRDAVSDRAGRRTVDLPDAVLETVARGFPATGRAATCMLAVLKGQSLTSGPGCPDPTRPPSNERGVMHAGTQLGTEERACKARGTRKYVLT